MEQLSYKNPSFLIMMELMKCFFAEITFRATSVEKIGNYISIQFLDTNNKQKNLKFTLK